MANLDQEKQLAARASVRFVKDGDIVGLGSGSTATWAIRFLGERVKAGLKIRGVPSSENTRQLASELNIPLATLDECPQIDVTIDGADEISPELDLIKGGGGAALREKVVASASRQLVIIGDSTKLVAKLGKFPVPVEVITFAQPVVARRVAALGGTSKVRLDSAGRPYWTDEEHHILDCHFGEISDPAALARELDSIPGIVEHGLFVGMASVALIGKGEEVVELRAASSK